MLKANNGYVNLHNKINHSQATIIIITTASLAKNIFKLYLTTF